MTKSALDQWLQRLETIHPRNIELGLERSSEVARSMGLLPVAPPVVTVAGTNGKGSTIAVLEALAGAAGLRCGVYTSPHLQEFNERIRIAGVPVNDRELIDAFSSIDSARGDISLTYFEFATLAALVLFRAHQPDILLLEVGLGGRLDAVNIVDATVAVITSIDLDHQDWLGDTREKIALEKAGILRTGRPAVIADREPPATLRSAVQQVGAQPALFLGEDFWVVEDGAQWHGQVVDGRGNTVELPALALGSLLPDNICAAVQAMLLTDVAVNVARLPQTVAGASLHGRREHRQIAGVDYILDVAHNPAAVNKLVEYISLTNCNKRIIAIFSVMADKDIAGIVAAAGEQFDAWFIADQPDNARAASAETVAAILRQAGQSMVSSSKNVKQAVRRAQSIASQGDTLVVFGSFSTVGTAMHVLDKDLSKQKAS